MVKKLSQKDEYINRLKQLAATQKIAVPTFLLEDNVIILPGVNKKFYFTNNYFKELQKNRSLIKFDQKSLVLFNLAKIDEAYANIGTVCILEEEKNDIQQKKIFVRASGLCAAKIEKIIEDAQAVELNILNDISMELDDWLKFSNKEYFQEIINKVLNNIAHVSTLQRENGIDEEYFRFPAFKKDLITKDYFTFVRWINNLLDNLLENNSSKTLLYKVLDYLRLGCASECEGVLERWQSFQENKDWFLKNTTLVERQIIFGMETIVKELKIMKGRINEIEEILTGRCDEEELIEKIEISQELIKRSIEVLKEIGLSRGAKKDLIKYLDSALHEFKSQLSAKSGDAFSEQPECKISFYNKKLKELERFLSSEQDKKEIEHNIASIKNLCPSDSEYRRVTNYLDFLFDLPWGKDTLDRQNLNEVSGILRGDHYGLDKPQQRILEYLAVRKLNPNKKGPVLCFVGPPGVGKTSLGRSIAKALNRKFVRISLGGVNDEAEIRGHRTPYMNAKAGRIIEKIKNCGSRNPVFMIDEIDKLTKDFQGDPASALLEVLDPEQNNSFSDHYLGIGFDLSQVMFITTANTREDIPKPLLDRMEVIKIHGYTDYEKMHIVDKFLVPKSVRENGLPNEVRLLFNSYLIWKIISEYTRESGVRDLERQIDTINRKLAMKIACEENLPCAISDEELNDYLGISLYHEKKAMINEPGNIIGLAYTSHGGDILEVEASFRKKPDGEPAKITITGNTGDQINESVKVALSLMKSEIYKHFLKVLDIEDYHFHVHMPEGAVPKDGPSAGLAILMSLVSALRKEKAELVAMTGEITLLGKVIGIGGLKEKLLAAKRHNIKKVVIPRENLLELKETPLEIVKDMDIVSVMKIDEALPHLFPRIF